MYSDALYWATSTKTREKDYHLTRTLEAVLRKLIHYSNKNEKITYSNEKIAEHTYMGLETIKKAIPELRKKNYVSTATIRIFDDGDVKSRRTIFIKWDFIKSVLDLAPKKEDKVSKEELLENSETENPPILPETAEVIKSETTNETVKDSKQQFRDYEKKCIAEAKAEQNKSLIITFKEFTKDYTIDEEISEALTPIVDLSPFMVDGKLKVNFNGSGQFISINSDDKEIKLPSIENSYHPELFDIPKNINNLEYDKDYRINEFLLEPSENNIEPDLTLDSSDFVEKNSDDGDDLPWL